LIVGAANVLKETHASCGCNEIHLHDLSRAMECNGGDLSIVEATV
jgi:hypothetical protein